MASASRDMRAGAREALRRALAIPEVAPKAKLQLGLLSVASGDLKTDQARSVAHRQSAADVIEMQNDFVRIQRPRRPEGCFCCVHDHR